MLMDCVNESGELIDCSPVLPIWLFVVVIVWSLTWKGFALWKAARRGEKWWFIALMIVNSLGILEAIYLMATHKKKK